MSEDVATAARPTAPGRPPRQRRDAAPELLPCGPQTLAVRRLAAADGTAEPVVLVHGLGQSSTDWLGVMSHVDGLLEPWAVDLPGHGASPPAWRGDYTPAAHAKALAGFLEQHVRQPVHLAGNSLGGLVSLMVAARRPHLVRTLTLVSPALPARIPSRAGAGLRCCPPPGSGRGWWRPRPGRIRGSGPGTCSPWSSPSRTA